MHHNASLHHKMVSSLPATGYYLSYATQLLASIYNVHIGLASTVDHPQLWQMLCIATVRIYICFVYNQYFYPPSPITLLQCDFSN